MENCNCIVCAFEYNPKDMEQLKLSSNSFLYICKNCLSKSDPSNDYKEVKSMLSDLLFNKKASKEFLEAKKYIKKSQ